MRIVCPNCGAQYEIPDEVIPENGRDLQCSNCGETWFQTHPAHPDVQPQASEAEDEPQDGPAAQADWAEPDEDRAGPDAAPDEEPTEPRQRLAPEVADVLRQEAERESRARAAEGGSLETQSDLGLSDSAETRSRQARDRMARLRGNDAPEEAPPPEPVPDIDPSSRRNLLPDIEDVDPALSRPGESEDSSARDGSRAASPEPARPGGFRRGFRLAVLLAALATAAYLLAPQLSDTLPSLSGPLESYVETVNTWRTGLNGLFDTLVARLGAQGGG